jgi:glycerol kinase
LPHDTEAFSGLLTPWWDVVACGGFLFRETTTPEAFNSGA